jgi:hypothetical protein
MKLFLPKGKIDVTVYIFIPDSSSGVGAGLTGLVHNSSGLVAYYVRPLGNATQLTLATQTVTGAHSDGGFVEVSSANMPGIYRLDLSDAICATGATQVVVMLKGATNMAPVALEVQLVDYDLDNFSVYQAKVDVVDDDGGTNDRYVTAWYKNSQPITSGITSPTIQVIKASDGTDLVASTAMTQIGSTGLYRKDEGTNRLVDGAAYMAKVQATIDGATRTWYQPVGRDS